MVGQGLDDTLEEEDNNKSLDGLALVEAQVDAENEREAVSFQLQVFSEEITNVSTIALSCLCFLIFVILS
jgi:hypothetical protein